MKTPMQLLQQWKSRISPEAKIAGLSALIAGLLIHMPILLSDIPNHDGLDSIYFDQNMITSGRWFLGTACGLTSYFTLPWLIGLLGLVFLAAAAAVLAELLEMKNKLLIGLMGGLLAAFPALASTFAYVYTLDGYMLALLLAVLSVYLTKRYRLGSISGAVCLAFSMGIYQAYLPFAVLLCLYEAVIVCMSEGKIAAKCKKIANYLIMGVLGAVLYYVILQILLKIQGKELANYQGINGMASAPFAGIGAMIADIYHDFAAFTLKGNVIFNNVFSAAACAVLVIALALTVLLFCKRRKWYRSPYFYPILIVLALGLPVCTNLILIVSPQVTYHLLIRYQWVLYPILALAFCDRYLSEECGCKMGPVIEWCALLAAAVMVFNYAVSDNIAYSNLSKRYEKTYAYCVRLLDRIEQTEGYYRGIPIAMIGVVGDEQFPVTDITGKVTDNMIGMSGDMLLYTGANYEKFIRHYLGASLNILEPEAMADIYYSDEYVQMDSFPGANSTKVVDGILYVKTENVNR